MAEKLKLASSNAVEIIDIGEYLKEDTEMEKYISIRLNVNEASNIIPAADFVNAKDIIMKALKLYYSSM